MKAKLYHELLQVVPQIPRRSLASALPPPHGPLLHPPPHPTARCSHAPLQAADLKGAAVGKRDAVHNLAMANQAAAHFRWRASSDKAVGAVDMDRKAFRPVGVRSNRRYAGPLRH